MDLQNSSPHPVPAPKSPPAQELPHLVVDEPKRSPWAVGGIIVLSLMVLAIPIGLFLVQQRTNFKPQAALTEPGPELATGIILESKFSPDSKEGVIPVDVYIKSPSDAINLASVKLKFNPSLISVDKIATSAASLQKTQNFNKWLQVGSDNNLGAATIIAGLPSPGIKSSDQPEGKVYLATINLRPKRTGTTVVQITSESLLLRNSDNQNVFQNGSDLVLNLPAGVDEFPQPIADKPKNDGKGPVIVITSPAAAANYSFFKPIDIIWSAFNVEAITQINLYLNGAFFGPITQNLDPKSGKFPWQPKNSLALPYIQLANTYMIEIIGLGRNGELAKALTSPFGIVGQEEAVGEAPDPEAFFAKQLSIDDASRLFSNYLVFPMQDKTLDFNRDEVINELDFYLLRQNLAGRGIIK